MKPSSRTARVPKVNNGFAARVKRAKDERLFSIRPIQDACLQLNNKGSAI